MQNYLNFYLPFKQQQLYGAVNYRGFRETGPSSYALVSQTLFRGETSGGVAKCRLFFQV